MDITPALLISMVVLAVGTFALRMSGPLLRSRISFPPKVDKMMEVSAVVLLASLVLTTALTEGGVSAGIARPAGVVVAGVMAWRKLPFIVVVLSAAAVTSLLRLFGVP
ncbi:AzlD domain-containing protein [Salinactinospora qingdaonensis]|uniref:AzlD domain-containing protein n=1 Tax=Salinactinospora qingdaonensis TaxID=702744 RepID=A0ABP7G3J7_9ACTN